VYVAPADTWQLAQSSPPCKALVQKVKFAPIWRQKVDCNIWQLPCRIYLAVPTRPGIFILPHTVHFVVESCTQEKIAYSLLSTVSKATDEK
jgi:hypothetical protein